MKTILTCLLLALTLAATKAANPDSIAYQLQRAKINGLLAQRAQKFDQYSQSLHTKTGIFGWQTKKDIRRSGEILMDIAQTDEVIFKQIKVLLDMKTFQATQVVSQSHETDDKAFNYMLTINKLRAKNQQIQQDAAAADKEYQHRQSLYIIIILVLIATSILLFFRIRQPSRA
jgi:hypothetical protein